MQQRRVIYCLLIVAALLVASCKKSSSPTTTNAEQPSMSVEQAQAEQTPAPATAQARPSGPIEFTDVTAQAGIHFKHNSGAFGKKYLPETIGSGCAFLDYDND